ncbi:MAG: glycosyltransferase family 2 protein [Erysipelotrichaceae bacterium]|nr:glycosyltransferase family 2 protein [Erysipelotrichaceae bacterium]
MTEQETTIHETIPEISIIVPVYHVENQLRRALDSILSQTFTDFELILVNDGGNEEESAICREYAEKDDRIVYLTQSNQGQSAARNRGLDQCRGNWIMFVDSDDWVREDFCEKALRSVLDTNADMGIFDLTYTEGDATEGSLHPVGFPEGVYDSDRILRGRITGEVQCYIWNKIYRRDLWKDIRFPLGEHWEDDAVIHEVIDLANTVAVIHEVLYYKPGRGSSITATATRDNSMYYWLWIQRCRRWDYLEKTHPEMLADAANNMVSTILDYVNNCLLPDNNSAGFEEVRRWAKDHPIPGEKVIRHRWIRYLVFLRNRTLFVLQEKTVDLLKNLKRKKPH